MERQRLMRVEGGHDHRKQKQQPPVVAATAAPAGYVCPQRDEGRETEVDFIGMLERGGHAGEAPANGGDDHYFERQTDYMFTDLEAHAPRQAERVEDVTFPEVDLELRL